jgi:hypothetical protein
MTANTAGLLPENTHLAYTVHSEAWYARAASASMGPPSISVGASYGASGGCAWEFVIEEASFDHHPIRVCLFDDAFDAFVQIPRFFVALRERSIMTFAGVRELLDEMGAADETKREDPYAKAKP